MKFADEFRDRAAARGLVKPVTALVGRQSVVAGG
jgi:hypothetical protein